jgi:hypothetical protein
MISGMLVIVIGVLSILGALLNWRIVVGSGKLIPRLLGPAGAKVFMVVVGLACIVLGTSLMLGLVNT